MLTTLILLAALATQAAPSPPESLQAARIPAEARWVVHLDVAAALSSTLLREVAEHEVHVTFDSPEWDEVRKRLDIDPLTDISAITVYGSSDSPQDAVALLATNARIETALERLRAWLDEQPIDVGGISLSHWQEAGDGDEDFYSYVARRADTDERLLVVSPDAAKAAAGVRVLRGELPNMGGQAAPLRTPPRPGAILSVSVPEGLSHLLDLDDAPQVARLLTALELQLGEHAGRVFFELAVATEHAEAVQQASQILQGATALAALLSQDQPEVRPFLPLLQDLRFQAGERSLRVHFEHDAQALADLLRQHDGGQPAQADTPAPVADELSRPLRSAPGEGWR